MTAEAESFPHGIGAEPPRPVHSYTIVTGPDGARQILVFKRVDFREVRQVAFVWIGEADIGAKDVGDQISAAFDAELVTRGHAAQTGESGNGGA